MQLFFSASHAEKTSRVTPEMLEKVWRTDDATSNRTVKGNTQLSRQDANTSIYRNFGTNNRMLRYRRMLSFFYTDFSLWLRKQVAVNHQVLRDLHA